jgi:hypothetical protein
MFGLFKSLFGKRNSKRQSQGKRATAKQLNYARKLGLKIPPNPTIWQLSEMLEAAEKANPQLRQQREKANENKRAEKFGADLIVQEQLWNKLGNQQKWIAVVYKSGKSVKADILSIGGASINDRGKLRIDVEVGKVVKDPDIGGLVETGRYFELDPANLLWSQVVDDFEVEDFARFQQTLAIAHRMAKKFGG